MKFKLPQLNLLVTSDKKISEEDSRKYIHVIGGHAIVNHEIIVAVDLRNYVKMECKITDESDLDRLTGILDWMEGKSFTKEYWKELVKECIVNLNGDDQLEIETPSYNKVLVYEDVFCENKLSMESIRDNINREETNIGRIAFNGKVLNALNKAFKTEMNGDSVIFAFCGQELAVKFTLTRRDYIFGLLPTNYNASSELTAFLNNEDFQGKIVDWIKEN